MWAPRCCFAESKSSSRSINYSTEGRSSGEVVCALFGRVNHSQSSHMSHRLQSRIMNQPCLLTVTVRLSSGQLECAARPWPLQSRRGQTLWIFPLPLSVSLTCLDIETVDSLSLDKNTLSLQASHLAAISLLTRPLYNSVGEWRSERRKRGFVWPLEASYPRPKGRECCSKNCLWTRCDSEH